MKIIEGAIIGVLLIMGFVGGVWATGAFIEESCKTNEEFSISNVRYKCERAQKSPNKEA